MKGAGRRRTQLLDNLRKRRRYWELKEEAEDRKRLFITYHQRTSFADFRKHPKECNGNAEDHTD